MAISLRMVVAVLVIINKHWPFYLCKVTFKRVIRKKSTEEFSSIPYIIALLNSLLYTWYGLPIISNKWENFPLVTVNGAGIPFELSYVKVAITTVTILAVFCFIAFVSAFAIPGHRYRKLLVGSIGLAVSIALYASPLVAMKKVIQTKSVEFMPLPLSLSSLLASLLWMTYGLLIGDIFVAGPNVVGTPLGILQIVLYCKYWKKIVTEEPNKVELQKGNTEKVDLEIGQGKKECVTVPSNCNSRPMTT
ncbi:hypothetical protein JHK87_040168 [Glycine soja]|nr:hypothetical protein JHK87_040168 [Glycine soja]